MELIDYLKQQSAIAQADPEFRSACIGLERGICLEVADAASTQVRGNIVCVLETGDQLPISLRANTQVWRDISSAQPSVGLHSFTAATRQTEAFSVSGPALQVAQALHALERLFEILRGQVAEPDLQERPDLRQVHGSYVSLSLAGHGIAQLFYEHSGNPDAPPLLMLLTAGADARQFHPIMADAELQQQWHMFAFDLPSHGRSMPLPGAAWQPYVLRKQTYISICQAFIEQCIGRPAVILGCSMGAAMALKIASACPDLVAGVVALEAPYRAVGRRTAMLAHSQVNQTTHNPSYVRGLMSPSSPLASRRDAAWIYSQGGFQVYSGDLAFYSEEFDAEQDLRGIDGVQKGICLLTGSYDYSATPADSLRVADLIPGARFTEMSDLGHFPMIEHPQRLIQYLKPELDYVRSKIPA
jgi:pimeloyl-ACP methyl ester carboxylesterase